MDDGIDSREQNRLRVFDVEQLIGRRRPCLSIFGKREESTKLPDDDVLQLLMEKVG